MINSLNYNEFSLTACTKFDGLDAPIQENRNNVKHSADQRIKVSTLPPFDREYRRHLTEPIISTLRLSRKSSFSFQDIFRMFLIVEFFKMFYSKAVIQWFSTFCDLWPPYRDFQQTDPFSIRKLSVEISFEVTTAVHRTQVINYRYRLMNLALVLPG